MPLFSVVIPTYNRAKLVAQAVDSVLAQTFEDYEIVVVDDGSTDNTTEVMQAYEGRLKYIARPNGWDGAARNSGVRAASGQYVYFLDSDDLLFPWTLQLYAGLIQEHRQPALIVAKFHLFSDDSELACVQDSNPAVDYYPDFFAAAKARCGNSMNGTAIRTDLLRGAGEFLEDPINGSDIDMMLRLGTAPGFVMVKSPASHGYRMHGGSISRYYIKTWKGYRLIIEREMQGIYPGGKARAAQRRTIITQHTRQCSYVCAASGQRDLFWALYRDTFAWNLSLGRVKFLIGMPIFALLHRKKATAEPSIP